MAGRRCATTAIPRAAAVAAALLLAATGHGLAQPNRPVPAPPDRAADPRLDRLRALEAELDAIDGALGAILARVEARGGAGVGPAGGAAAGGPPAPPPAALAEILFAHGGTGLGTGDRGRVAGVAEAARRLGRTRLRVVGYSDRTGPPAANARLARRRAEAVAAALREAGFEPAGVEAVSALEAGLPLPVPTVEGVVEPRNRSVRIYAAP